MTATTPTPMSVARTTADGGFELAAAERPAAGPTEVLIEVSAAGVNPADWKSREMPGDPAAVPGAILGWDVAGTVVELGVGVTRFELGDRVFGMPRFPGAAHTYAEFATARSREVARVPDDVSIVEAGAVPLAGLTAWQALVDTAGVLGGDRVLIHAASGGVGHLAVQIAKARGAEVWGTASPRNHDKLRELGADHLIDYRTERFEEVATDMDVVLGLGGGPDIPGRSVAALKPGGHYIAVGAPPLDPQAATDAGVQASFLLVEPDYAGLEAIAELMASGELRVVIAAERPLAEMADLHEIGKAGSPLGKLVARVGQGR